MNRTVFANLAVIIAVALFTVGCGPMAAVGMVGSAITRAANQNVPDKPVDKRNTPQGRLEIAAANVQLGLAYMQQGQYEKSLMKLEKAKAAKRDYAPVYSSLGLLHQRMDQPGKAEVNFKRALELAPNNPSMINTYASFLCKRDYQQAEELFLQAANDPLYATPEHAFSNAGTCALNNNERLKAEGYFRQALEKNPNVSPALIQMAELSFQDREYVAARDYLNRYLAIAKHTSKSLWIGVNVENELGDKDKASSYALLLRNQFPDTEEAKLLNTLKN